MFKLRFAALPVRDGHVDADEVQQAIRDRLRRGVVTKEPLVEPFEDGEAFAEPCRNGGVEGVEGPRAVRVHNSLIDHTAQMFKG